MTRSVSTKLGDALRRKSTKAAKGTSTDNPAPSQMPVKVEPRVLHGHTLTKGTTFREICYAIRDSAFVASDLPVIVSLEVHAGLEQQQMMVDIVNEAWKGLLVEPPPNVDPEKLPTLADSKRKILIKAKSVPLKGADNKTEEAESPNLSEEPGNQSADGQPQKPAKPSKVLDALSRLAVYTRAYHFNRFDQPGTSQPSMLGRHDRNLLTIQQKQSSPSTFSPSPKKQPATHTSTTATLYSSTTAHPSCESTPSPSVSHHPTSTHPSTGAEVPSSSP